MQQKESALKEKKFRPLVKFFENMNLQHLVGLTEIKNWVKFCYDWIKSTSIFQLNTAKNGCSFAATECTDFTHYDAHTQ